MIIFTIVDSRYVMYISHVLLFILYTKVNDNPVFNLFQY